MLDRERNFHRVLGDNSLSSRVKKGLWVTPCFINLFIRKAELVRRECVGGWQCEDRERKIL